MAGEVRVTQYKRFKNSKALSYAESAEAVHINGKKIARDPKKSRAFLLKIGVLDGNGELAVGFQ